MTETAGTMRIALLSDIHANLQALQAVDAELSKLRVDEIWSLGDVVGYGADPRSCLAWVQQRASIAIKGNHDEAVATGNVAWFNPMAAQAARLHAQKLTPTERNDIYAWPLTAERDIPHAGTLAVHASPDDPLHEYVQPQDARLALRRWEGRTRILLMGHTHRPFVGRLAAADADRWNVPGFLETTDDARATNKPLMIINPGSVGQPRDGDPRASFAILDYKTRTVELHRVAYDIEAAAQAILKEGLDHLLALRLYEGR